jgi:hypothetical protein
MTSTREQNVSNLRRAKAVRLPRREWRRGLRVLDSRAACAMLADTIEQLPDWLASAYVDDLLDWCPRLQRRTILRWLAEIDVHQKRQLCELTERQRKLLCDLLHKRAGNCGNEGEGS